MFLLIALISFHPHKVSAFITLIPDPGSSIPAANYNDLSLDFVASGRVTLAVTDNGRGAAGSSAGFGLIGIRERIEVIGGRVESGNRPGGGFALTVEVPA